MSECESFGAARSVTPSDTTALSPVSDGIYVGTGGNITGRLRDSSADVVFKNIPNATELDYEFQYIRATGTTAADIVALNRSVQEALSTPSLSNFSALGAAPLVLQMSTSDYVAGLRGQLQIATDAGFASVSQDIVFFIDGNGWARLDEGIGMLTPSGTYYARARILRDNESGSTTVTDQLGNTFTCDASYWSNTFTDTITASAAALNTANGVNKNQYVAVSGGPPALTYTGTNGVNSYEGVRATIQAQSAQVQMEVTINAVKTNSLVLIGFENATDNFNGGSYPGPGATNANGIGIQFHPDEVKAWWSSASSSFQFQQTAGVVAVGDIFTIRLDKTAHTIDIWRTRSGTTTKIGGQATGLPTLSAYFAFAAPKNNEGGTFNFGASTFAKPLDNGYAIYG